MKSCLFIVLTLVCLNVADAYAAGPNSFQCIRPDGSVVCTVNAPSGDPSTICNRNCPECNLTCVARQRVVRDGNELIFNPETSGPAQPNQPDMPRAETPQFCKQQLHQCTNTCRLDPNNRSNFNLNACVSSCKSVYSGCGRR
ncbi:hypothetical protein [Solidesulfovibrio sp.]